MFSLNVSEEIYKPPKCILYIHGITYKRTSSPEKLHAGSQALSVCTAFLVANPSHFVKRQLMSNTMHSRVKCMARFDLLLGR